jgi:hypothetical protein
LRLSLLLGSLNGGSVLLNPFSADVGEISSTDASEYDWDQMHRNTA